MIRQIGFLLLLLHSLCAIPLKEELREKGYVEVLNPLSSKETFDVLYFYFDEFIEFLQKNPFWEHKLYSAKERFIRSKNRNFYSTDFFGFYDESKKGGRSQISFYYSTHFHDFISVYYPEIGQILAISRFLKACREIQKPCAGIFCDAAKGIGADTLFSSEYGLPPILFKVVKYFSSYIGIKPHYDGTAFSLFLDSTDPASLLLSPYQEALTVADFSPPVKQCQNSILLIPGAHLTEFSLYPTPHLVLQSGKTRYAAIAFAMRPKFSPQNLVFSPLPSFRCARLVE